MRFGRGAEQFVCECGRFYYTIDGCHHCKHNKMRTYMARKVVHKKLNGMPIKAYQKRGQKAYISKMANMFFNDTEKFLKALERLEKRDGNDRRRINQIKRKIVEKTKSL